MSTQITLNGNLTADPELKFTAQGKALAKFTVVTSRRKKLDSGEWVDEGTTFWSCTAWERLAENVAETLRKGDTVIVIGEAETRAWEKDGQKRDRIEVNAKKVAIDLNRFSARVNRESKGNAAPAKNPADDLWRTDPAAAVESMPF